MRPSALLRLALAAAVVGPLTGDAKEADAAPIVRVKGRSTLDLAPIRRVDSDIVVEGTLADRVTQDTVTYAVVELEIDGTPVRVTTDSEGRFQFRVPVAEGSHSVRLTFAGDESYAPSQLEFPDFDAKRAPLSLAVDAALDEDETRISVVVKTMTDGEPISVEVDLYAGPADAPRPPLIETVETDDRGRAEVEIDPATLGPPGVKVIEARFRGDRRYDAARHSTTLTIKSKTDIEVTVSDSTIAYEDELEIRGTLRDARGEPMAGELVSIEIDGAEIATDTTDDQGNFSASAVGSDIGEGEHAVQAVYTSSAAWLLTARSEPVKIQIATRKPIPLKHTLAAFAVTALALVAFGLLRHRPWEPWLARRRRDSHPAEKTDAPAADEVIATGLRASRAGPLSTLRRASDHGFSGRVCDAITSDGIAGATVELSASEHPIRAAVADADGRFAIEELTTADWDVVVRSAGYCTVSFSASIPHRGELRDARVDLLSVRERIFGLYRQVAQPLLPKGDLWAIWTPRQIVDFVVDSQPSPALAALTDFVEESFFSQRVPDEPVLGKAEQLLADATAEAKAGRVGGGGALPPGVDPAGRGPL